MSFVGALHAAPVLFAAGVADVICRGAARCTLHAAPALFTAGIADIIRRDTAYFAHKTGLI